MAGIQQKRKSLKSFKNRRKVIPVLIPKKGKAEVSTSHNQHLVIKLTIKIPNY